MKLFSVSVLVCLVLASHELVGAAMKEWQCRHQAPTGPARYVHLDEAASYRPSGHLSTRSIGGFRIFVYYDSSVEQLSSLVQNRLKRVVSNLVEFYESALRVSQLEAPIIFDRDCQNGGYYIFQQPPVRRCQSVCVPTMCGEVQIPDQHLRACSQCFGTSRGCSTTGTDGPGISDTDFVLYVSAIETSTCGGSAGSTIAYAAHCHQEDMLDRPIAGHANFCPSKIESPDADDSFILAVAKHEVLHALAFSTGLYAFWRDGNGNPRTPRDERGQPPRTSSGYLASSNTLRTVTYDRWETRNGPVSHTVHQLVTPAIVAEGRRYFNCSSLEGVEVENQGGPGTALSHWEKRVLDNEGMTGVISSNPVFSSFTFALLEDSGWYTVDYSKAQLLVWGSGTGCDLPTGSCGEYIQNRQSSDLSISPFCNRLGNVSPQTRGCTLDRTAISQCNLVQYTTSLPNEYQYFNFGENFGGSTGVSVDPSAVGGGAQISDFCPSQSGFSNGNCSDTTQQRSGTNNGFAETYASGSRCVEHAGQWSAGNLIHSPYGSGCYQYRCSDGKVVLYVLGQAYPCNEDGQTINVDVTRNGVRYQGSLVCPSCVDICYDDFRNCPAARTKYDGFNKPILASSPNAGSQLTSPVCLVLFLLAAVLYL